jgi:hypothetical protein
LLKKNAITYVVNEILQAIFFFYTFTQPDTFMSNFLTAGSLIFAHLKFRSCKERLDRAQNGKMSVEFSGVDRQVLNYLARLNKFLK